MSKALQSIKNYYFPTEATMPVARQSQEVKQNLRYYISKVQFQRIRQDIKTWRDAITEAEQQWLPYRVRMQRIFQDTVLNGHVLACLDRRYDLTLLRDFKICDDKGIESDELKKYFRNITTNTTGEEMNSAAWFDDFMKYTLQSPQFGYSLIALGDIKNDAYPDITVMPRQNVSPDRLNVASYVYSSAGAKFLEEPYADWHVWVPTPSDLGASKCGYGLLYNVAYYEIFLRNNMGFNADFIEVFGQPIRKGRTTKTDENERGAFEQALANMGSSAYILLDEGQDEVELVEAQSAGTGWQSYENFEQRCEKKISKMILGHADALDSIPGKLGGGDGDKAPTAEALRDKQVKDGIFVQNVVNTKLIPRMRKHGFDIPLNFHFEFVNDSEKEEFRRREDNSNKVTADIALTLKNAGLQMDPKYFEERTGVKMLSVDDTSAKVPLASTLGVGGTQGLISVLTTPGIAPEARKATIEILFGLKPEEAARMVVDSSQQAGKTEAFAQGDKVMVKPGKEHMKEHAGIEMTIDKIEGDTYAVKLPDGSIHKWYTGDELMAM